MIIKVYPGSLVACRGLDEDGNIEVDEKTTVGGLLRVVKVPVILRPLIFVSVNGLTVDRNHPLKQGDAVGFMTIISGG
jgi:sulfur carrier protein ThiS